MSVCSDSVSLIFEGGYVCSETITWLCVCVLPCSVLYPAAFSSNMLYCCIVMYVACFEVQVIYYKFDRRVRLET